MKLFFVQQDKTFWDNLEPEAKRKAKTKKIKIKQSVRHKYTFNLDWLNRSQARLKLWQYLSESEISLIARLQLQRFFFSGPFTLTDLNQQQPL